MVFYTEKVFSAENGYLKTWRLMGYFTEINLLWGREHLVCYTEYVSLSFKDLSKYNTFLIYINKL